MRKKIALLLVLCLVLSCFAGCGSSSATEEEVVVTFTVGFSNQQRTMTYNQSVPLTLSDGSVVTQGMLKPVWAFVEEKFGIDIQDVTTQDSSASDLISVGSTTGFSGSVVWGGNSIATSLINYGAEGYFISLTDAINEGKMPNFAAFLAENPDVATAITAYDGNIYHVPYTAEIGNSARHFVAREDWFAKLLDNSDTAAYDTSYTLDVYYEAYYTGDNARTGEYGGTVNPSDGVYITKETTDSIIDIQNALSVKNGATLTAALVEYIENNYPQYDNPSELYLGTSAAYDIDELVALWRCVKTNPEFLSDGATTTVWPFFVRQATYREDYIRLVTYYDGVKVYGSDSYSSMWSFDENGELFYTYVQEDFYYGLTRLSDMYAEGLFFPDGFLDGTDSSNHRTKLYDADDVEGSQWGFMTYDWISSTTSEGLAAYDTSGLTVVLPPVAEINGTWQYFNENTRAIKPDGWSISSSATEAQQDAALEIFDYFFTDEGSNVQNYGLPTDWSTDDPYIGPDGVEYPKLSDWTIENATTYSSGDASTFLRDYVGAIMAVGFVKEIGMEYQATAANGFASWEVVNNSNMVFSSYSGEDTDNSNGSEYYSMMIPPAFSMTSRQTEQIDTETTVEDTTVGEYIFNVVLYDARGDEPSGTYVPNTWDEYWAQWEATGIETYVAIYNAAYAEMSGS